MTVHASRERPGRDRRGQTAVCASEKGLKLQTDFINKSAKTGNRYVLLQRVVHVRRDGFTCRTGIRGAQVQKRTKTVHVMITEGVKKNRKLWAVK